MSSFNDPSTWKVKTPEEVLEDQQRAATTALDWRTAPYVIGPYEYKILKEAGLLKGENGGS